MWIEQTALAQWVGQADTVWAYATILFLHTLALAMVVGISTVISLRLLGIASRIELLPLDTLFPLMWAGFALSAISGALLFITDASRKLANPYFVVKMIFVVLAAICMVMLKRRVFNDPLLDERDMHVSGKVLAVLSMVFWIAAITAGRLIAYYLTPT